MALPEIIKDINDQVSAVDPNGDTMIGNLLISTGTGTNASVTLESDKYPQFIIKNTSVNRAARIHLAETNGNLMIINRTGKDSLIDADGETALILRPESSDYELKDRLLFMNYDKNGQEFYSIYGQHNKPTPSDISAYALVPTSISLSTDVLSLPPGRYAWDGMTTSAEAAAMNLPAICWHGEVFIQSTYNITGHANTYKVVNVTVNSNEIWQNTLSWDKWTGWKKIVTAPFSGVSGTYGINISGSAASLSTARTISLTGDITGSGNFNGSANLSISTTSKLTDALRSFSPTTEPNNTTSYKVILTKVPTTWFNARVVLGVSSRHTGNGIVCISFGNNDDSVASSSIYGQIVYYGNNNNAASFTGTVFSKDMFQLYYNASKNEIYLFIKYNDYNNAKINVIDAYTSGGSISGLVQLSDFSNGTYVTSINSATYGTLICQTTKGWIEGDLITGAVWNDYAEYRTYKDSDEIPHGRVVIENGDDSLSLSTERLQLGGNICSDTFGFAIGETDNAKLPIAVSGRVLAYTNEPRDTYKPGEALCSGPNGTVSKMTREEIKEYPDAIIGYVSAVPDYEVWGTGNVKVDGRIWVKIK